LERNTGHWNNAIVISRRFAIVDPAPIRGILQAKRQQFAAEDFMMSETI
jgi:hypothetical protein